MLKRILPLLILSLILTAGWYITPRQIEFLPLCFFKYVFHLDCPGCGLTRSFLSLARGHFIEAVRYNPAGPLVYLLFGVYFLEKVVRLKKPGFALNFPPRTVKIYSVCVVVFLFGNWAIKLLMHHRGVV